jgi:hypothetical protein
MGIITKGEEQMLKARGFLSRAEKKECRLKKQRLIAFSLIISIFFLCGTALAVPFTWTDTFDPSPDSKNTSIDPIIGTYTYSHDLKDFTLGEDVITGYTLTLSLYDDHDCQPEIAFVNLPGIKGDGFYNFSFSKQGHEYDWSFAGVMSLNKYGRLDVTIYSLWGDFFFDWSKLTAWGENHTAPVPEPASMLLFGTGLIVFGLAGRKLKAR